jgi:HMG (high mobility group) box
MSDISPSPGRHSRHASPHLPASLRSRASENCIKRARSVNEEEEKLAGLPKKKKAQLKVPKLDRPLSEFALCGGESNSVEDIEAFVNRSLEERRREAAKAGKIKRELNPFLLYRKAYKTVAENLIKDECQDISHINPRISKLCGHSWKTLEPASIRAQYETWSKVEKDRLKEAFPNYRYQPNKRQRGEDQELPAMADAYGPVVGYAAHGQVSRHLSPEVTGFGQTPPPPNHHEATWLRECNSPGDAFSMAFSAHHMPSGYVEDPFPHERSPMWTLPREHPGMAQSWPPIPHQHDPFKAEHGHKTVSIDPKLYYDGLSEISPYQDLVEESEHVPPGQYLLSAPLEVTLSRGHSPELLSQAWASSIPGNENGLDLFGNGPSDDWFGTEDGAAI